MMDNLQPFGAEHDDDVADDDDRGVEAPPQIGTDERRMHVRAYNYWASLLHDRPYPTIADLDPAGVEDFGGNSVLLDFTGGVADPKIAWLGRALREECGLDADIARISEVPGRSLLSRLTDHYLQIIANQAPVGFEAEFVNQRNLATLYRGILMPFSSEDDDEIDFIYGVINWKELVGEETELAIAAEVARERAPPTPAAPVWADGPSASASANPAAPIAPTPDEAAAPDEAFETPGEEAALGEDASLADWLVAARASAEAALDANQRSRAALYGALSRAYDFALSAEEHPEDYAELLDDAGIVAQARAPMTPVVKLVFGIAYDKTRLTEFATALGHARRAGIERGGFSNYLEGHPGGLKALVAAERAQRRGPERIDTTEAAYQALREARILGFVTLDQDDGGANEFALFVARRMPDGRYALVAPVPHDEALTDRAARKAAR